MSDYDEALRKARLVFDKDYYKDKALELCNRKGWDKEKWEDVAEIFCDLQIDTDNFEILDRMLSNILIGDMDDALS